MTRLQIVFLKLDCPADGTLKSLCLEFFQAVDRLTGSTRYYHDYGFNGTKQRTAIEMLPDMARVAALHAIGLLIIDEIQFLSKQKSGGVELMLHWFTTLVNKIKLPVILIGTPRADDILNAAFWQMRRNAGQGEGDWQRMAQDAEWDRFLRALWRYQYVRHPADPVEVQDANGQTRQQVPADLSNMLYHESQGIADFAVKIFMVTQERAINSGLEQITPELIGQVARDAFGKAREIIQAIRTNDATVLAKVDDVKFDFERARSRKDRPAPGSSSGNSTSATTSEATPASSNGTTGPHEFPLTPVLPLLLKEAVARGESGAAALRQSGHVRLPTEFGI